MDGHARLGVKIAYDRPIASWLLRFIPYPIGKKRDVTDRSRRTREWFGGVDPQRLLVTSSASIYDCKDRGLKVKTDISRILHARGQIVVWAQFVM